jgi:hypothetical protein
MTALDEQARTMTIRLLMEDIRPFRPGQKPEVLGELVALSIAGHRPSHRLRGPECSNSLWRNRIS